MYCSSTVDSRLNPGVVLCPVFHLKRNECVSGVFALYLFPWVEANEGDVAGELDRGGWDGREDCPGLRKGRG